MKIVKVIPVSMTIVEFDDGSTYTRYSDRLWTRRLADGTWEYVADSAALEMALQRWP